MIAITGASGQLGQLVVKELLKLIPAKNIIVAVRDPQKVKNLSVLGVNVRQADYNDAKSLTAAFQGASKVLLISSNDVGNRIGQHKTVIDSLKNLPIELLAYTSILNAENLKMELASDHQQTEKYIKDSKIPAVILRNGWYSENYTANLGPAFEHGAIFGAAKNGKISSAARADYAAAAAAVLTKENQAGKIYELAGDQGYSLLELAQKVSELSGKKVIYQDLPEQAYEEVLIKVGLPAGFAHILANSDTGISHGELYSSRKDLSQLIGRATTLIETSIKEVL